jgi:hypothetical protein
MKSLGGFLALAGVMSIVLNFIGYNLKILMWIDNWGVPAGWGIRVGLIVVGALVYLIGSKMEK